MFGNHVSSAKVTPLCSLDKMMYIYNYACVCLCLSELLLGVSPRSGMCVPGRVVARSFSTLRLVRSVGPGELLLGGSPRSGMCAPGRAVARSFSMLGLIECIYSYCLPVLCMYITQALYCRIIV